MAFSILKSPKFFFQHAFCNWFYASWVETLTVFIKISLNGAFSSSSSAKLLGSCCGRPAAPCLSVSLALVHSLMSFFFFPSPLSCSSFNPLWSCQEAFFWKGKMLDQWRGQKDQCARNSSEWRCKPCGAQKRLFFLFCFVTSASHYPLKGNGSSNYKRTIPRLKTSLFPVLWLLPAMDAVCSAIKKSSPTARSCT